jgi:hypothetical protein
MDFSFNWSSFKDQGDNRMFLNTGDKTKNLGARSQEPEWGAAGKRAILGRRGSNALPGRFKFDTSLNTGEHYGEDLRVKWSSFKDLESAMGSGGNRGSRGGGWILGRRGSNALPWRFKLGLLRNDGVGLRGTLV